MKLGETVEKIRYEKNIPVKELIGDRMSKSTYSRFINNKTFLGTDSYLFLIDQLHMTFAMFLQLYTDFFELKYDYTILNHCLELKQVYRLSNLLKKWQLKMGRLSKAEELFLKTVEITLMDLQDETIEGSQIEELNQTYKQFSYWTDYNLKSLKSTMHLLDTEKVIQYTKQIITAIDDIEGNLVHEEVFYVLGRVFTRCLSEGLTSEARTVYESLRRMYISQYDLGKQGYSIFYEGLANIIFLGIHENVRMINDAIEFFKLLDMDYRVKDFSSIYKELSQHYELPELMQKSEVV